MIDRDDLTFTTCYQLAGEIREEWEERPEIVEEALKILSVFHEPDYIFDVEKEKPMVVTSCNVLCNAIKAILAQSDGWKTVHADMLKKELISRVKEYEARIISLTSPVLSAADIGL